MSDIVERLRDKHCCDDTCNCDEAADEIERLLAGQHDVYAAAREEYRTKIAEQATENERLREALHRIGLPRVQITYCRDGHEEAVLIARAALGGGK